MKKDEWKREHERYLKTPIWARKREEAFAYHGKECASCGSTKRLCIHHISYITYNKRGKGKELMRELIPLCQHHHHLVHALIREFLEHHKYDYKYNWNKASRDAIDYLVPQKRRKATAKKVYNKTAKKGRRKKTKKQRELDKLNRGIGCAKGSRLRYISAAEEFLDERKNS